MQYVLCLTGGVLQRYEENKN